MPFLILPIIVRYLTPEDYGIITNYVVLTQILAVFVYVAAQGSISVNYFKQPRDQFQGYVITIVSIAILVSIVSFALFAIFQNSLEIYLGLSFRYLSISVIEVLMGAFTCINLVIWRCEEKPMKFGLYHISQTIINVVLTLLLVVMLKMACEGKILANFAAISVLGLLSVFILQKKGVYKFKLSFSYAKVVLAFALPLVPHALALWGKTGVDKILITNMSGLSENGLYSTAFTWAAVVTIVITSFGNAYNPYLLKKLAFFDKNVSSDNHLLEKKKIVKLSYLFVGCLGVLVLICYFIFYALIILIYPESYHPSTRFLPWILLGEFFRGCYLIYVNFIHYTLNTKVLGFITFSLTLIQVLLSYLLIYFMGAIGAAISTCIISLLTALCVGIYSNRVYPMPWLLKL